MYKAGRRPVSRPFDADVARPADGPLRLRRVSWLTLIAIAAGGVLGALARQGLWTEFPHHPGAFDWTTLGINTAGCVLIGALMTAVTEVRHAHRLAGPFLGIVGRPATRRDRDAR